MTWIISDRDSWHRALCVCVCAHARIFHGIPLTRHTHTHTHTHTSFCPIAVRLPDTPHQHSETHTAEHEHLVLHTNHRELWDTAGRPIPSHCSQLHGAGLTRIMLQTSTPRRDRSLLINPFYLIVLLRCG